MYIIMCIPKYLPITLINDNKSCIVNRCLLYARDTSISNALHNNN